MKIVKILVTVVVVVFCIMAVKMVKEQSYKEHFKLAPPQAGARFKGATDAKILIKEYTDFQCPACGKAVEAVDELLKKYNGQVRLEHKHFPLPLHKNSMKASIAAECAARQGKFWPFHDVLFKSQTSWTSMDDPSQYFEDLALQLGLDTGKMKTCVAGKDAAQRVNSDKMDGEIAGVRGTPTFVIDGQVFVGANNLKTELESRTGKQ